MLEALPAWFGEARGAGVGCAILTWLVACAVLRHRCRIPRGTAW